MKIVKKIIHITLAIALFTTLPFVVFTIFTSKSPFAGFQSFVVLTGSMEPSIPVGSVIYTQKQDWYPEKSIIAFKSSEATITHRVIKVVNKDNILYYETKGDANNAKDSKIITNKDILGQQVVFVPYIGKVIMFFKTPLGFFGGILFPIIVYLVFELWNLKKEIGKEVEKKLLRKIGSNTNLST